MRHYKRGNMRLFLYYLVPFLDPDPNNKLGFGYEPITMLSLLLFCSF
jgi:hypothetical protein